jgi:hypothetical protein
MIDALQRTAFEYFPRCAQAHNGLVADTSSPGSAASIAVVGFALSAYTVGVSRGWMARAAAVQLCLKVLRFLHDSDQTGGGDASGYHGFYFHFLDLERGRRAGQCELSSIDTAFLIMGMLTAAAFFDASTSEEVELRQLAEALYHRVDWRWAQPSGAAVVHGWKPECGFLNYAWQGYNESAVLHVLGLGSPTIPLTRSGHAAWTATYQWEHLYGVDFLYAGPLFVHQFSHAWIDFRGIRDRFMRQKDCDYFENSRRAITVQREYCKRNPRSCAGYGEDCWGLSAGDGPDTAPQTVAGRRQSFWGYTSRGVPWGPDDGTINGASCVASLVFEPEIALRALRKMYARVPDGAGGSVRASGFNATVSVPGDGGWLSRGEFGLDQGLIVLMIENFRTGLPWRLGRSIPGVRRGLQRAGFTGGWL